MRTKPVPNVELVSVTEPVLDLKMSGCAGIGELVCYCARVSNPSGQLAGLDNGRLLAYLVKHQHWSPFEMVSVCMEINTTRDIARQILRHRSFSFQEFSQRYADPLDEGLGFTMREARLQDLTNRQSSIELDPQHVFNEWFQDAQMQVAELCDSVYTDAIARGIAKEQARAVLPEGLTNSKLYMSGTLRSWIHYVTLRASNGTQKEHREIAEKCKDVIISLVPEIEGVLG